MHYFDESLVILLLNLLVTSELQLNIYQDCPVPKMISGLL